jgi:hypothetical protein
MSEPYEDLNNRLASYETCLSESEIAEADALLATEPCDKPRCEHLNRHFNLTQGTYECANPDCKAVLMTFDVQWSPRELRERARLA